MSQVTTCTISCCARNWNCCSWIMSSKLGWVVLVEYSASYCVVTVELHVGCPESILPFWISREPVLWPWCNLAASQRRPYYASVYSHSPMGLGSRQWDATDWASVLCDRHIHNDRASRSASSQQMHLPILQLPCRLFFGKASHQPGLSAPLQPRFGSLRLLTFPKVKSPLKGRRFVNVTVTQYTRSVNSVSLPTD